MSVYKITAENEYFFIDFSTVETAYIEIIQMQFEHKCAIVINDVYNFFRVQNFNNVKFDVLSEYTINDYADFCNKTGKLFELYKDNKFCINLCQDFKSLIPEVKEKKVRVKKEAKPKAERKKSVKKVKEDTVDKSD